MTPGFRWRLCSVIVDGRFYRTPALKRSCNGPSADNQSRPACERPDERRSSNCVDQAQNVFETTEEAADLP